MALFAFECPVLVSMLFSCVSWLCIAHSHVLHMSRVTCPPQAGINGTIRATQEYDRGLEEVGVL